MKTIKELLEVYKSKSPDEQRFVDKHVTIKHKDRNGNDDDVFNAKNIKTVKRSKDGHGYDVGEDEKVYESYDIGDHVHLGFGTKGGLGFKGKIKSIDGNNVIIVSDYNNKEYKGHIDKLSKLNEDISLKSQSERIKELNRKTKNQIKSNTNKINKMNSVSKEIHNTNTIKEVLDPSLDVKKYIEDFVSSKDPRFKGKTRDQRIKMALGAYYGDKVNVKEEKEINEGKMKELEQDINSMDNGNFKKKYGKEKSHFNSSCDKQKILTKENVIENAISKYFSEEQTISKEEYIISMLENHATENQIHLMLSLYDTLNEENKVKMLDSLTTKEGINTLLDFALEKKGE